MSTRRLFPILLLTVFLVAMIGCQPQQVDPALLTPMVLPTVTPSDTPTITPTLTDTPLPTRTASPAPTLACGQRIIGAAAAVRQACGTPEIGEVCFGAPGVSLIALTGSALPPFAAPGDRLPLALVERVDTSAFDPASGDWGVALLRVQANPDAGEDHGTMMALFGQASLVNAGDGGQFRQVTVATGPNEPGCAAAPAPGVLFQSGSGESSELVINGLSVHFAGTILVRAQAGAAMVAAVLSGEAQTPGSDGSPLVAEAGTEFHVPLAGADGLTTSGPANITPFTPGSTTSLPLAVLAQPVAVAPAALPTRPTLGLPTQLATLTDTPQAPFYGTPPSGVYLEFQGREITPGQTVSGTIPAGGSASWVFTPVGFGPDIFDYFEVTAQGNWDPAITLESATWGVYEEFYDASAGPVEAFYGSLAGSGGNWRITVRAVEGSGSFTLLYDRRCQGTCPTE